MREHDPGSPRARYAALEARLGHPGAHADRETIKTEIITLFRDVEQEIAELTALREDVKRLVERWKQIPPMAAPPAAAPALTPAPAFTGDRPTVQADHLGASTFAEKGWNLIALGDHEGAEQVLLKALALAPDDPQTESLL